MALSTWYLCNKCILIINASKIRQQSEFHFLITVHSAFNALYYPRLLCSLCNTIQSEKLLSKTAESFVERMRMDSLSLPFCYEANVGSQQTASAAIETSLFTTTTTEKSTLFSSHFETIMDSAREYTKYIRQYRTSPKN